MQIKKQCKYDETSKRLNICLYISKTLFKGFLDACRHRNTNNTFSSNERKLPIKLAYLICISMLNLSVDLSLYLIKMCVCCNVSTKYNAYQKFPFITTNVTSVNLIWNLKTCCDFLQTQCQTFFRGGDKCKQRLVGSRAGVGVGVVENGGEKIEAARGIRGLR